MHLCFSFFLVLVAWPIGEYVIIYIFTIPSDRIETCLWVFRVSLVSALASMISVPFTGMFTAKQHISEIAAWGVLRSLLVFLLAFVLTQSSGDLLLFYAIGMVLIIVLIDSFIIYRAFTIFPECRILLKAWFDFERFKKIFSFAIWNLVGSMGGTLRDHGSAILLNLFFGPRVNAAYGIAKQVSAQANQLSIAMIGAFSPEITSSEGRGDRKRMLGLSHRASKFGTILVMLFAIPLIGEMEYVLQLWLRNPPPYTGLLCRLILCTFLIDRLSKGYMIAVNARGKIAAYQATVGGILVMTLPLAWFFLWAGFPPTSLGVAFILIAIGCTAGRVFWLRKLFAEPISRWFTAVLLPCLWIASITIASCFLPMWLLPQSFIRLVFVTFLSVGATLISAWFLALDSREHEFVKENTFRFLSKFTKK